MKQVVHDRPQRCPQRCAVGEADTVRIGELVAAGGGIVHRQVVLDAGIRPAALRVR